MKRTLIELIILFFILVGPIIVLFQNQVDLRNHWSIANRKSLHLAPDPFKYKPAVIQIYAARTYNWRGLFATHTWIATKAENASTYAVYQVIGWRKFWRLPVFSMENDIPDRTWFGNKPWLLKDLRGEAANKLIEKIKQAALSYPYKNNYDYWPGPNSNTFTAFVIRSIPELKVAMPPIAMGKDFLGYWKFFAKAPSKTGYQFSLRGIMGILVAWEEGIEINLLGMVFGINLKHPAIILPGIGKIPNT